MIYHPAPGGVAGFVLANGSMSSNQSNEGAIRRAIIEDDLVDCMVALPGQLFYSTQIPACLWFLRRGKREHCRRQVLFIDARQMGRMVDRTHRELTDEDIRRIADTYYAWRGEVGADGHPPKYEDVPGFCKSATLDEIRKHNYVLTPGRYVGAAAREEDAEPFDQKMRRLTAEWRALQTEARRLDEAIEANLRELGYGG